MAATIAEASGRRLAHPGEFSRFGLPLLMTLPKG